jgi:hypothetical protein
VTGKLTNWHRAILSKDGPFAQHREEFRINRRRECDLRRRRAARGWPRSGASEYRNRQSLSNANVVACQVIGRLD